MREISVLDGLVFLAIVICLMPFELTVFEICDLVVNVLLHVPLILIRIALEGLGFHHSEVSHYRNVANLIQQLIIRLAGFAFDRVSYKAGRLFLGQATCHRFVTWRLGWNHDDYYKTFTIAKNKRHKETLMYKIDRGVTDHKVENVILYVHGGGFVVASVMFYLEFLISLQSRIKDTVVISPEYDLVPESTHPTQINQIIASYEYIKRTYPDARVILGGDSAGGGLCQALLLHLSKEEDATAARLRGIWKAFYISPWLDLDACYPRAEGHGDFISVDAIKRYGRWYTPGRWNGTQPIHSIENNNLPASPLSADDEHLKRSIPSGGLYITCGGAECLVSDARNFTSRVKHGSVTLHVEPNEVHAHVLTDLYLRRGPSRFVGFDKICSFIDGSETSYAA